MSFDKDVQKLESSLYPYPPDTCMPHTLLVGQENGAATLENSMTGPQMTKQSITGTPSNSTPTFLPKRNEHRYLHGNLFMNVYVIIIVNSLIIMINRWKRSKCSSTDEYINEMCCSHAMEYYSALERNEVLTRTTTWMNLEITVLNERSQPLMTT